MRNAFRPVLAFVIGWWICAAAAQAPSGYQAIYDEPTGVNLGGRPVVAEIALFADIESAKRGELRLALVTDVTAFIEETERDLENWIATHQERCGNRWGAGEPFIAFPPGAIRFALYLELEVWNCGWDGKGEPGRLALEAGKVDVTLNPYVEDGKLQARLGAFSISEQSGLSKYLPLEFVARQALNGELKKLNENRKFYRAPRPLYDEGFVYESIGARQGADGRVVITARYKAKGSVEVLNRLVMKVREDGLTQ
ncbi:MAG: hypothetical protein WD076_01295 [Parvularculaceae bacterium]